MLMWQIYKKKLLNLQENLMLFGSFVFILRKNISFHYECVVADIHFNAYSHPNKLRMNSKRMPFAV